MVRVPFYLPPALFPAIGLSPRGRGNRRSVACSHSSRGSIPAWAGEPTSLRGTREPPWVYPRVGGGTAVVEAKADLRSGLSPRGRGNRSEDFGRHDHPRSIPAWAGEPNTWKRGRGLRPVYPRVGGGTMPSNPSSDPARGLSPRGRGNRLIVCASSTQHRSIPAWAGEPCCIHASLSPIAVYPRVGGGTSTSVSHGKMP